MTDVEWSLRSERCCTRSQRKEYVNFGQTSAARETCEHSQMMQDRDRWQLTSMITTQRRRILHQIASQFNTDVDKAIRQRTKQLTLFYTMFLSRQLTKIALTTEATLSVTVCWLDHWASLLECAKVAPCCLFRRVIFPAISSRPSSLCWLHEAIDPAYQQDTV